MSHDIDETYDVYNERRVCARKVGKCGACEEPIRVGDKYMRVFIKFAGGIERVDRCARCQAIHEHLRGLAPGDMWPDEQLNCGESYEEHWSDSPPEDIAALAFALPGEVKL